ncbi:GntR family transcriptional regulator [Pleionea sp. CnH1-48]|uniref:GntR family transcriptional regulator n=1 Tax=Pleionea sp. CnH1-48 TaxID=2954494 RepID=UPI0020980989|nr:GntR family transcriptional regulator [Pleionea sp. CnH1-48]MCO7225661.1 GntR family transcriptional regulator [Pleionea sp. CnH1-48]
MTIEYKTRTQAVAEAIREKILSGAIKGGQPLRQNALADELKVSRIPVREALLQLEAEGLVKFEAHKGAVATELSPDECRELFELRAMLETEVLKLAISNQQQEDWDKAENILDRFDSLLNSGESIENWSELNQEFHNTLYQPSHRTFTLDLIRSLNTSSDRYIRLQLLLTNKIPQAESEHRELLELCREGNKRAACKLLKQHIEDAGNAIASLIEQQQEK